MNTFGIIAEFNPLHNGHKYIIDNAKSLGATHITAVMSGNFVQRGDLSVVSLEARAKMAIKSGVDLVLELPIQYAVSTAQKFAYKGIDILKDFSDNIIFGSETANLECFNKLTETFNTKEYKELLNQNLNKGITFAKARYLAAKSLCGESSEILNNPNDTLGLEYILEGKKINKDLNFYAIKRIGAMHDSNKKVKNICSASFIRDNLKLAKKFMPKECFDILKEEIKYKRIANIKIIENSILTYLKRLTIEELENLDDISEGIENRIYKSINEALSLEELYSKIKTKRYTLSRIRRLILNAYLGINKSYYTDNIPYVRVLAFNDKGAEIIKKAKKNGVKVITSLKDAEKINDFAKKNVELTVRAGKIYGMALNKPYNINEYKYKVYKEK